jgi:hypothetical protein
MGEHHNATEDLLDGNLEAATATEWPSGRLAASS